jgi:hypothetical protein
MTERQKYSLLLPIPDAKPIHWPTKILVSDNKNQVKVHGRLSN